MKKSCPHSGPTLSDNQPTSAVNALIIEGQKQNQQGQVE